MRRYGIRILRKKFPSRDRAMRFVDAIRRDYNLKKARIRVPSFGAPVPNFRYSVYRVPNRMPRLFDTYDNLRRRAVQFQASEVVYSYLP